MQREPEPRTEGHCAVGVDISKDTLDICFLPQGRCLHLSNDNTGHTILIKELLGRNVSCLALEATGPYHTKLHQALDRAGLPVSVVNPYRSRKFADVCGRLAKTDRIDAVMLARFALVINPPTTPVLTELMLEIKALVQARETLVTDRSALKSRLEAASLQRLKDLFEKRIKGLDTDIEALEAEIAALIEKDESLDRRFQILLSIPGIGPVTAMMLVASMPELGHASAKEIAALTGLAPMNWDSGFMRGKRAIRGGRFAVRKALYMPALSVATRGDTLFSRAYQNHVGNGKPFKVAIMAIMRKLIVLANTLIRKDVQTSMLQRRQMRVIILSRKMNRPMGLEVHFSG